MIRHPSTRAPAVAGRFYPAEAGLLRDCVKHFLRGAVAPRAMSTGCKAIIAPHAGYEYSGPIAGSAFRPWSDDMDPGAKHVDRIVVIGPSHHVDFDGIALPESTVFETPLGSIDVDPDAESVLKPFRFVNRFEPAHVPEHAIEVELPFLQFIFGSFRLVPLVVGRAVDREVAETVDRLWGGPETRFVISSDLSHYLDAAAASVKDQQTADAIDAGRFDQLTPDRACGYRAIRGFMSSESGRRLTSSGADLGHSGDTGGPRDRVVGYGAFHFLDRNRD